MINHHITKGNSQRRSIPNENFLKYSFGEKFLKNKYNNIPKAPDDKFLKNKYNNILKYIWTYTYLFLFRHHNLLQNHNS